MLNFNLVSAPVGDTEEEVASELDTDELKSCLWVGWTPWASNCQKHNLELGRKYRYRLCSDRGKGNKGKFQIKFEKHKKQNHAKLLYVINSHVGGWSLKKKEYSEKLRIWRIKNKWSS